MYLYYIFKTVLFGQADSKTGILYDLYLLSADPIFHSMPFCLTVLGPTGVFQWHFTLAIAHIYTLQFVFCSFSL